jgi:DNA-binding CsgD family transcriptional regulator
MTTLHRPWTDERIDWTARQWEVLGLMAKGRTNPEIAEALGVSLAGAKWHVSEVMTKLGVSSRDEAAEYWREQNRLPRRFAVAIRGLFGVGLLKTAAIGAATATVVAGGAAVTLAVLEFGHSRDQGQIAGAPAATPVPPDPAVSDGLTLRLVSIKADDTETTVHVALEGRTELGRFGSPPMAPPNDPTLPMLVDQDGNAYRLRSFGGVASREVVITFDPVLPAAKVLTFTLRDAAFVNPAAEVPEGQRPPDPSAVVPGPWILTITEWVRHLASSVAVDRAPRAYGPASVVLDDVKHTDDATVVYAHLVGVPMEDVPGLHVDMSLVDATGASVARLTGRWGDGPARERIEWRFGRTSGSAALRFALGVSAPPGAADRIVLEGSAAGEPTDQAATIEAIRAERASMAERLRAWLAGAVPVEWQLVLPD